MPTLVVAPVLVALLALACASPALAAAPRVGGRLEGLGVVRLDHPSPRQRPLARVDLWAEQAITPRLRWKLATTGRWGGTLEHATGAGLIDFGHSFQNVDPSLQLDEAWVEWLGDAFDVRVGNQRFTWGRLDGVKPNDLLNPLRYYDPFITDENDQKIAVPSLALSYYPRSSWRSLEEPRVTLVWQPIAVPWLFPEQDERWFPPAASTDSSLSIDDLVVDGTQLCPCLVDIEQRLENAPAPARRFDNGNVGLRISGRTRGVDWSAVFYDGYDPAASFTVPISLTIDGASDGVLHGTASTRLRPAYLRFQSLGVDASTVFGGLTTRFEAAWRFRRPYPRDVRRLSDDVLENPKAIEALLAGETVNVDAFARRDAVEWGIGADYLIDGWLPLIELYQIILLHNDTPLLIRDVDSRLAASLRKSWMSDRLETKLVGLWGIESGYELVRAEATYAVTDALELRAGVLGIWGNSFSLIGEFKKNSELYARIRYSF
ncbi:MAG TPA: hypothetical protein VIS07_07680 [Candidatus Binatia bacterium]